MPFIQKAIARLRENGRFAVLAGTDSEQFGHDVSCATPSRRTETQQLVNYLYNCGKRRLALVGFGQHSINDNFRYHAAMSAVAAWGLFLREKDVWLWEHDPMESFAKFVSVADQYDSVICPNDMVAVYFIEYLRQKDIQVPEQLYVASFGNMSIGNFHRPSITSMTMDMLCVGEQAFSVWRYLMKSEHTPAACRSENHRSQQNSDSGKHRLHPYSGGRRGRLSDPAGLFLSQPHHCAAGGAGKLHQSAGCHRYERTLPPDGAKKL